MPKRTDISSILIVGAGPIIIGQACEFDYSGTQACKALRSEGYRTILINSNPATIMTDPATADRVYIEPITPEVVEKIIAKERPDAILPTVGGQTALNCCLELHNLGVLKQYDVEMIGASPDAIDKAENRRRFNQAMANIGLNVAKNAVVQSLEEAMMELERIGLPAIIRPSFTLGGTGGGIANTEEEFKEITDRGLRLSPTHEVLIDESALGWKEYEMEVIRDKADNVIIICSIENIDPMGVHTGDSITVAPAQTLTDKEYQRMRNASIAVLREIGVETGGSNVQFAIDPETGRMIVIEMNPRVSRSSALASKATGFPIAKIAAKLAVGFTLDELKNDITKTTPASFEPTIDYIVTKIPRFTFEKFNDTQPLLSTAMRSVGEVMSIGRNFAESLQKGLRSLETGLKGLDSVEIPGVDVSTDQSIRQQLIKKELIKLSPNRILIIGEAFRNHISIDEICEITKFDRWFVEQLKSIVDIEAELQHKGLPQDKYAWLQLKKLGFADEKIAELTGQSEIAIYKQRHDLRVRPVYKMIDTCAAEFASFTPYMYSTYEGDGVTEPECEAEPSARKKVVILGSGPNRIGQGIEFDYSCTHASVALAKAGYETIMVNCNPETVSTDYDTSDRLYFEPLTSEDVTEILHTEQKNGELVGVIVTLGGQTPLKLSQHLHNLGFPIAGTPVDSLDLAEDRQRFKQLLNQLNLIQPHNATCNALSDIEATINKVGYPVVIRPSNVLGGRAMAILSNHHDLVDYLRHNDKLIMDGAILIDKFLSDAIEIDVDAIADGEQVYIAGIMEHIEHAGVHSGDSTCSLPTRTIRDEMLEEIRESTTKLAEALSIRGLINIQYAIKDQRLYVIEVNPRASRTVPFVAKATGFALAGIASRVMLGEKLHQLDLPVDAKGKISVKLPDYFSVKEVVFPFARFKEVDIKLRPEMQSTGEVMGIDANFELAFYKAQLAAGYDLAKISHVYIDGSAHQEKIIKVLIQRLEAENYKVICQEGLQANLQEKLNSHSGSHGTSNHSDSKSSNSKSSDSKNISYINYQEALDKIKSQDINLVIDINAPGQGAKEVRQQTYAYKVCHTTTLEMAYCMLDTMVYLKQKTDMPVRALQDYYPD